MFHISQYPEEQEILLPPCCALTVNEVVPAVPGEPLILRCSYDGTLLSDRLQLACWCDLQEATCELKKVLEEMQLPANSSEKVSEKAGAVATPRGSAARA